MHSKVTNKSAFQTGAAPFSVVQQIITYDYSVVKLSQLVQQPRSRLVDRKLFPLDFYRSAHVSLPRQQHSRFVLLEAEQNGARLESFSRRRVGVVGHDGPDVTVGAKTSNASSSDFFF